MSKKMITLMAAGFLVAVAAAFPNDAWKDKDFQNWDQKDVQKILTDSPWSKKFQYASTGTVGNGSMTHSNGVRPGTGGGAGSASSASDLGDSGPQEPGQQINLVVSWFSSRTIREAMARKKELAGMPQEDERKTLSQEPTTYEVVVSGTDLTVFGTIQEDNLKVHSYLMSKITKEKVAPVGVVVERAQNDQPVAIIFQFAKTTASGAPMIAKNEKGVEFFTQAGKIPIRIQFDLSKMTDKLGSDY
jgi:hypothetical protein